MIQLIAQKTGASIRKVCVALGEARSSFYHAAKPTPTQVADADLGELVAALFKHHRRRYGYRRLCQELADRGVVCAPARMRRIMAEGDLRANSTQELPPQDQRWQSRQALAQSHRQQTPPRRSQPRLGW